tara:strand:+ start:118374 stop:119747 length:1374 start_codon:yes stop_codon:yes gene_type:complete
MDFIKNISLKAFRNKGILLFALVASLTDIYLNLRYDSFSYILPLAILARLIIAKVIDLKNVTTFMLYVYFELSFTFYILLTPYSIYFNAESFSLKIGESCIAFFGLLVLMQSICSNKFQPKMKVLPVFHFNRTITYLLLCIVPIFFTAISYKLDIMGMGVKRDELPFKIEHILNLTRSVVIPFFFTIFIGRSLYKNNHLTKKDVLLTIVIYNLWLLIETILRSSKGFILINNFPVLLLLFINGKTRMLKKAVVLFIICTPIIFFAGQAIREKALGNTSYKESFSKVTKTLQYQILGIYQRNFYDAEIITKFFHYVDYQHPDTNRKNFYDNEGSVNYHTYVIDNIPRDKVHSSGTTLLADGYLLWSRKGIYISLFVIFLFATLNDLILRKVFRDEPGAYIAITFWIYGLTFWADGFWSFFMFRSPLTSLLFPILLISFCIFNIFASRHPRFIPKALKI